MRSAALLVALWCCCSAQRIDLVSPRRGSSNGATRLTISGDGFAQERQFQLNPQDDLFGNRVTLVSDAMSVPCDPCEVQTVSDSRITCLTPEPPADHLGLYPGGRGLKMEVWNDTVSHTLSDIWTYTDNSTGYWWHWLDSLPHRFPLEFDRFSTRTSGFLVPPATGNFTIYLHCDDKCELYLSNSSRPEHKARVAFQPYYVGSHGQLDSQKSQVMHLQGGTAYYLELLQMEYRGHAHIDLGLFQEQSPFTREQTLDALNEVQHIVADYQASDEEQVLTFDSWSPAAPVREVQRLSVSCLGALCGSASFSLSYGDATTGDFGPLGYEVFGLDANISVAEITKGRSSMETFTLLWGGVPTKPIAFNATESEYGGVCVPGLSVDIGEEDLQFALEGIAGMGQLKVSQQGSCRRPKWRVEWLTRPGDQPLMEVEVYINGIPSRCSGDCSFSWSEELTPVVTGISPSQGGPPTVSNEVKLNIPAKTNVVGSGSHGLGTLLTVTGTGFRNENATIRVGNASCRVEQVTASSQVCRLGPSSAGSFPVWVSFPSVGAARHAGGLPLLFTYQLGVSSVSPPSGSLAGGTLLTLRGFGFGPDATVTVGGAECALVQSADSELKCRTPAGPAGAQPVVVRLGNWSQTASSSFTYDGALTPKISSLSPQSTTVIGEIHPQGSELGGQDNGSMVLVGGRECPPLMWTNTSISCLLPVLQPGLHRVEVQVGARGFPQLSPASLTVFVGDTVVWRWEAPAFQPVGYRVFSVSSPSGSTYEGGPINSGEAKTAKGVKALKAESQHSQEVANPPANQDQSCSGPVDGAGIRRLQGVVKVRGREDKTSPVTVRVGGVEARQAPAGSRRVSREAPQCEASPQCQQSNSSEGLSFSASSCSTPTVTSISPNQGSYHQVITIQGRGFSLTACANEVTIGGASCRVLSSSESDISCQLPADSGLPVGAALPVAVSVRGLGAALVAVASEPLRRFALLPVVDSVAPAVGSPTGGARLLLRGSGFSEGGAVTAAGEPCGVLRLNYTHVECAAAPSRPNAAGAVLFQAGRLQSSCSANCSFLYSPDATPLVSGVSPDNVDGPTVVTISGAGFGAAEGGVAVFAGAAQLELVNVERSLSVYQVASVTDGNITARVGALPAGAHPLAVLVRSRGLAAGGATLTSRARAALSPPAGSLAGGTPLVVRGNGFAPGNTSVALGGAACRLQEVTPGLLRCLSPPHAEDQVDLTIRVLDVEFPPLSFNYSADLTPNVSSISPPSGSDRSPPSGPSGSIITLTGSGFGADPQLLSVTINHVPCNLTAVSDSQLQCTAGSNPGGTYPVVLHHGVKGHALSEVAFTYELTLSGVQPTEGSFGGGALLTLQGSGFDPHSSRVLICGEECDVLREKSTSTRLYCQSPANNGSQSEVSCPVSVVNPLDAANISAGFTYKSELTPVIREVSPRRGGTAGGTRLTIAGSGFSSDLSEVSVSIAGSVCDVQSSNLTHIVCLTGAQNRSQEATVRVAIGNRGVAQQGGADFFYIDVWSSRFTWGGLTPPERGSFVVITKGQTILLDASTPVLKMLLIQGGTLVFDEADLELQAENILITDGGRLQVGQEGAPFQHKAVITLHGNLRSPELPVYGTKTLAVREGQLDLHGLPVPVTWTHLAQTAPAGSDRLTLMMEVTWKPGDQIVIASTGHRHSQRENEVRSISSVSADGRTLTLTEPLSHAHLGVAVTLPDGTVFQARAEVGLLTRNIVVRGSQHQDWNEQIQACPDGFDTGEFATQTCFQGRFGEEAGSDQFGGCIMFHAPRPGQNLAVGRLEYVEVSHAGQAFRLGRYPIHWHLMGDIGFQSYVRGCSIHRTFNRAVTIHNTHRLLVEHNVVYDVMGGAFFIEDGVETQNVLQYNLAVLVKQSTSLLNDDVTPAAFWVTNPDNVLRHNAAAGGSHFGFWYRMHEHPDGPSYDPNVCQKRVPLGEFSNNTVHSQGWFGLWIFQDFFPMRGGGCRSRTPAPAVFRSLTAWNCEKGAEWVNVGAVQFSGFLMVNNEKAGVEAKRIFQWAVSGFGEDGGATVTNSTMVGHLDELGLGAQQCTHRGVIAPLDDGMSVLDTKFINFNRNSCAAVGVAKIDGTCVDRCGGWAVRFAGVQFLNAPNKAGFRWEHEVQLVDTDGSLTGNANHKVVPMSSLLDPARCSQEAQWSVGFPGAVCDHTVEFHRLAFNNPTPTSLKAKDAIFTNSHGTERLPMQRRLSFLSALLPPAGTSVVPFLKKRMTHKYGWMALLPSGQTYNWYFDNVDQITNITYNARFYGFKRDVLCPNAGRWVVLDADTPPLNKLTIVGVLEIPDTMNQSSRTARSTPQYRTTVVDAVYISIQDEPFRGQLLIKLRGNHNTPDWPLPNGPNQGSKVLGVFGSLELFGLPRDVYHTKLAATAAAGSTRLTLAKPVDWQAGDEIAMSTSSYDARETEKHRISAVSADGRVLTLSRPLSHTHIGDTHSVAGTSFSYTLAADVGLLTRNIKVEGAEYPDMLAESFGARLLVGAFSSSGIDFRGKAQIRNVEFFHSGQEGWTDSFDPRYSVAFLDLGQVPAGESDIQGCAFHDGFSPAIGVFGTEGLHISDNVVHHTVGEGIRIRGSRTTLSRNLVMMSLWPGSYQDREEPFNFDWNAAIEVIEATGVVLQHNIVAGFQRVAYRVDGEPCPGSSGASDGGEAWVHNEAHGGLYGVYLNGDGLPGCSLIQGFFVWRSFDYGIYFQVGKQIQNRGLVAHPPQVSMSVVISNVTLVENGMGVMPLVYGPPSLSHALADKTVLVQDSWIVGSSPSFNCSDTLSSDDFNVETTSSHRAPRPPSGGRSGICWPTFQSAHNTAPAKPHHLNMNYNAIKGLMRVTDTTFVHFGDVCSGETDFMFMTNPLNEDLQHPVEVSAIRTLHSSEQAKG
ncbi:unnamed protein product [Menidia menidia]|uniref:(Atlantic silverside) hypothetical protein n=1 Tax=Menidia menidia TaxID=238744 RepID=A0A8S4BHV5_9TELE|nr:unnamed protein product [Menidia menidia]